MTFNNFNYKKHNKKLIQIMMNNKIKLKKKKFSLFYKKKHFTKIILIWKKMKKMRMKKMHMMKKNLNFIIKKYFNKSALY